MVRFTHVLLCSGFLVLSGSWRAVAAGADPDAPAPPRISLLSKQQGEAAFVAEEIEPYFSLMTRLDMTAKTGAVFDAAGLGAARAECKRRYAAAVRDFSGAEATRLRGVIERLHTHLAKHYPLLARTPWRIIKKADGLEAAAHFTREDCIVLSESFLKRLARIEADDDALLAQAGGLLLHEQTHVLQRLHPEAFVPLYQDVWGFIRARKIESCTWLDERLAVNPDAVDLGWVFPLTEGEAVRYIWPRVICTKTDGVPRMFRDYAFIAVEVDRTDAGFRVRVADDGSAVHQPLRSVEAYVKQFRHGGAYHPNEAAAGAVAAIIMNELRGKNDDDDQRDAAVREWMRRHLK